MFQDQVLDHALAARRLRWSNVATLGPWRILEMLGEGSWTRVYRAAPIKSDSHTAADYAIKVVRPDCIDELQAVALLQREAFVGQQISHPHLTCVLSAKLERSPQYLVYPFQPGVTIRGLLKRFTALPMSRALWIVRQVAEALTALHERQWLHGDVKPENCFVAHNGHVTLGDLGFARQFSELHRRRSSLMGTLAYLAPELLCDGMAVAGCSDVYALGVMLFELLTGQLPFPQSDPAELTAAHRLLPPPDPRQFVSDLPPALSRLLRQMLAKEPLRRPTGTQLVSQLVDLEIDVFDLR